MQKQHISKEEFQEKFEEEHQQPNKFNQFEKKGFITTLKELIEEGQEKINECKDKELILLIGQTGAGKSTLINYLLGNTLKKEKITIESKDRKGNAKERVIEAVIVDELKNENAPKIGHNVISETSTVNVFQGDGILICDSPGYSDTNGPIKDVVNQITVTKALKACKSVIPIFVISCADLEASRGQVFLQTMEIASKILTNQEEYIGCLNFLFSKPKGHDLDSIKDIIDDKIQQETEKLEKGDSSKELVNVLEALCEKIENEEVLIPDIIKKKYTVTLKKILKLDKVKEPSKAFKFTANLETIFYIEEKVREIDTIIREDALKFKKVSKTIDMLIYLSENLELESIEDSIEIAKREVKKQLEIQNLYILENLKRCLGSSSPKVKKELLENICEHFKILKYLEQYQAPHLEEINDALGLQKFEKNINDLVQQNIEQNYIEISNESNNISGQKFEQITKNSEYLNNIIEFQGEIIKLNEIINIDFRPLYQDKIQESQKLFSDILTESVQLPKITGRQKGEPITDEAKLDLQKEIQYLTECLRQVSSIQKYESFYAEVNVEESIQNCFNKFQKNLKEQELAFKQILQEVFEKNNTDYKSKLVLDMLFIYYVIQECSKDIKQQFQELINQFGKFAYEMQNKLISEIRSQYQENHKKVIEQLNQPMQDLLVIRQDEVKNLILSLSLLKTQFDKHYISVEKKDAEYEYKDFNLIIKNTCDLIVKSNKETIEDVENNILDDEEEIFDKLRNNYDFFEKFMWVEEIETFKGLISTFSKDLDKFLLKFQRKITKCLEKAFENIEQLDTKYIGELVRNLDEFSLNFPKNKELKEKKDYLYKNITEKIDSHLAPSVKYFKSLIDQEKLDSTTQWVRIKKHLEKMKQIKELPPIFSKLYIEICLELLNKIESDCVNTNLKVLSKLENMTSDELRKIKDFTEYLDSILILDSIQATLEEFVSDLFYNTKDTLKKLERTYKTLLRQYEKLCKSNNDGDEIIALSYDLEHIRDSFEEFIRFEKISGKLDATTILEKTFNSEILDHVNSGNLEKINSEKLLELKGMKEKDYQKLYSSLKSQIKGVFKDYIIEQKRELRSINEIPKICKQFVALESGQRKLERIQIIFEIIDEVEYFQQQMQILENMIITILEKQLKLLEQYYNDLKFKDFFTHEKYLEEAIDASSEILKKDIIKKFEYDKKKITDKMDPFEFQEKWKKKSRVGYLVVVIQELKDQKDHRSYDIIEIIENQIVELYSNELKSLSKIPEESSKKSEIEKFDSNLKVTLGKESNLYKLILSKIDEDRSKIKVQSVANISFIEVIVSEQSMTKEKKILQEAISEIKEIMKKSSECSQLFAKKLKENYDFNKAEIERVSKLSLTDMDYKKVKNLKLYENYLLELKEILPIREKSFYKKTFPVKLESMFKEQLTKNNQNFNKDLISLNNQFQDLDKKYDNGDFSLQKVQSKNIVTKQQVDNWVAGNKFVNLIDDVQLKKEIVEETQKVTENIKNVVLDIYDNNGSCFKNSQTKANVLLNKTIYAENILNHFKNVEKNDDAISEGETEVENVFEDFQERMQEFCQEIPIVKDLKVKISDEVGNMNKKIEDQWKKGDIKDCYKVFEEMEAMAKNSSELQDQAEQVKAKLKSDIDQMKDEISNFMQNEKYDELQKKLEQLELIKKNFANNKDLKLVQVMYNIETEFKNTVKVTSKKAEEQFNKILEIEDEISKLVENCDEQKELKQEKLEIVFQFSESILEIYINGVRVRFFKDVIRSEISGILDKVLKKKKLLFRAIKMQLESNQDEKYQPYVKDILSFSQFKTVNIEDYKKKFATLDLDHLLKQYEGFYDLEKKDIEIKQLKKFYNKVYEEFEEKIQFYIASVQDFKKREEIPDIVRKMIRQNKLDIVRLNDQITSEMCKVLGLILASWSLLDIQEEDFQSGEFTYIEPNKNQILTLICFLQCMKLNKSQEKKRQKNVWNMENLLMQVKTGEGKSVIIGIASVYFALIGYNVEAACYSKYLSQRDKQSFNQIFDFYGISKYINYGTFNELIDRNVQQNMDIRYKALKLFDPTAQITADIIDEEVKKRKNILIIDEVDTFFQDSFYGKTFNPVAKYRCPEINSILQYIWNNGKPRGSENKCKYTITELYNDVTKTQEFKNLKSRLKSQPEIEEIIENQVYLMCKDITVLHEHDFYVVHQQKIGYKQVDHTICTKTNYGYLTMFAYFKECENGEIDRKSLEEYQGMYLKCGNLSYTRMINNDNFALILGVSGTIDCLNRRMKEILNKTIKQIYISAPLYSSTKLKFVKKDTDYVCVDKSKDDQYLKIQNFSKQKLDNGQSVIVFFDSKSLLAEYKNSAYMPQISEEQVQILTEESYDKELIIERATQKMKFTLATKEFGRGTDFKCSTDSVLQAGGVVIIQSFLSLDNAEEVQIKGRTARQEQNGSYHLFLSAKDLEANYLINENTINQWIDQNIVYDELDKVRSKQLEDVLDKSEEHIKESDIKHEFTKSFLSDLEKNSPNAIEKLRQLNTVNKIKISKQKPQHIIFALDDSGSMTCNDGKPKNRWYQLIEVFENFINNKIATSSGTKHVVSVIYHCHISRIIGKYIPIENVISIVRAAHVQWGGNQFYKATDDIFKLISEEPSDVKSYEKYIMFMSDGGDCSSSRSSLENSLDRLKSSYQSVIKAFWVMGFGPGADGGVLKQMVNRMISCNGAYKYAFDQEKMEEVFAEFATDDGPSYG